VSDSQPSRQNFGQTVMADKYLEQLVNDFGNNNKDLATLLRIQDFHHRKYGEWFVEKL
jgi:hypothetical protein